MKGFFRKKVKSMKEIVNVEAGVKVDMRIRDFMTGMIVRSFSCHRKLRPMTQKCSAEKQSEL